MPEPLFTYLPGDIAQRTFCEQAAQKFGLTRSQHIDLLKALVAYEKHRASEIEYLRQLALEAACVNPRPKSMEPARPPIPQLTYFCSRCTSSFDDRASVVEHMRAVHGAR